MNSAEFARALRLVAVTNVAKSLPKFLINPPGRRPAASLVELSHWFRNLEPSDQDRVGEVVLLASEAAASRVLEVLDGIVAIEGPGPKGTLELFFVKDGNRLLLNDPTEEPLADLLRNSNDTVRREHRVDGNHGSDRAGG
jgi:hypothetical protein